MRFWCTDEIKALSVSSNSDALSVAAMLGRTPRAVQDKARAIGAKAPRMKHRLYWPESTKRRALNLRAQRMPLSQISAATGVPFGTVRRWVYE